ncbi:MAG: SUMF1/EgtB/PvdO family nonheme iron enzyme [Polyangiaceae bacterium]
MALFNNWLPLRPRRGMMWTLFAPELATALLVLAATSCAPQSQPQTAAAAPEQSSRSIPLAPAALPKPVVEAPSEATASPATNIEPPTAPLAQNTRDMEAESAARSTESEAFIPAGTYVLGPYDFCLKLNPTTGRLEGKGPTCKHGYLPAKEAVLRAYFLNRAEVTVAEYGQCVKAGRCKPITEKMLKGTPTTCSILTDIHARLPGGAMNCVNHTEATTYCAWKGKRLPTDAEWETAARGGDQRTFVWGDEFPTNELEMRKMLCWSYRPCLVRKFGPYGPFKLYGMESGVREWTSNPACESYPDDCTPEQFGVHGGAFFDSTADSWDSFSVGGFERSWRSTTIGFRCARDAE